MTDNETAQPNVLFSLPFPGTAFDVVAVATSVGGLRALSQVLGALPADFPAAVLVVQHLASDRPSLLVDLLCRTTGLRVKQAEEGDRRIAKSWRGHKLLVWQGKRRKGRRQEPWKAAYWGR